MKQTHTPGPWKLMINGLGNTLGVVSEAAPNFSLAKVELKYRPREINEANAKLIAAAPELLEALNQVIANTAWQNIGITALDKALKLINRLEGTNFSVDSLKAKK
jgi:hypothetical protein